MKGELYQYVVTIVALGFVVRVLSQYFNQKRTGRSVIVWGVFWLTVILLSVVPDSASEKLADLLGFKDNVHAVIFLAIGLLFLFTFYYSTSLERIEKKMTQIVRDQALRDALAASKRLEDNSEVSEDEDTLRA